jgi:hypothetical protein
MLDHLDRWQRVYSNETAVVHIRTTETAHRPNWEQRADVALVFG